MSRARPAVNNVTVCVVDSWSVCERVARREVVEPQAERHRSGDAVRAAQAPREPVDERDQVDVQLIGRSGAPAERSLGADRMTSPADLDRPGVAVVRQRVQVAARGAAEDRDQGVFVEPGDVGDRRERPFAELLRRDLPDTPQPLDRQRVQEPELVVDRDDEQAVGLRHAARHLRQELRARDADGHRDPDALTDLRAQACGDLSGRAGDPPQPADVQERFVDREAFHERRGVTEHVEHRVAGFAVRLHPRANDDRLRAEAPGLDLAHRRVDAERLGFVARGEHDPAADDHGLAAERGIVALFDRRVEGVGVRMQDRGFLAHRADACTGHRHAAVSSASACGARPGPVGRRRASHR